MPELPEVETTKRGLAPVLEGYKIINVIKRREKIRIEIPSDFEQRVTGQRVKSINRRAKYIQILLDSDDVIICHLGMSGKFILIHNQDRKDDVFAKHDHVIFETEKGDLVIYNDPRRFGIMTVCKANELDEHVLFRNMAAEPLGNEFNSSYLEKKIQNRKSAIKTALLDQHVVVGLGNIYVCEALNLAGISPLRRACDLTKDEIETLIPIIRNVLKQAIDAGGSTLKDFAQVDGELGYFQHQFQTYGRENKPCTAEICTGTIQRITQAGRSTFYCPECQK